MQGLFFDYKYKPLTSSICILCQTLNNIMRVIRDFSERTLREIKWWAWGAAVLPITALAGLFFVWAFGTEGLYNASMALGATFMFAVAAVWWWWIIWTVAKILKKDREVAEEFRQAQHSLKDIKNLIKETFTATDK
jgi:hypothetical protein